ncbi:HutD family protein [Mesorhizobium sp. AR07]|uniref:HutD/Ves family protein n=1 Tax=Mesorhizobium sp. AR07 TaxID=2865838 RepID=UPI00215EB408|nr:HutD family protein [Mesorhizobium sp. AR07]UVK41840.1 HutD family protein [Mesorhizobium sp. AR07]
MLQLLSQDAYHRTAWKNGRGVTEDVLLLPEEATHADFDIRISRAPIVDDAQFSSFPGIDRTIIRLSENPLVLSFADGSEVVLDHLAPYRFDSALSPKTRLSSGSALVMNVMTRRVRWSSTVRTLRCSVNETLCVPRGGLVAVHVVGAPCWVAALRVGPGQTLVARDAAQLEVAVPDGGDCLIAVFAPEI